MPAPSYAEVLASAAEAMSSAQSLDDTLRAVVRTALDALPVIDHAGVTLIGGDEQWTTSAATDDLVQQLDEIQYSLRQGPCNDVLTDPKAQEVVLDDARHAARWHDYLQRAVPLGLRCQYALKLSLGDRAVGGLNLYSTSDDHVDEQTREVAPLLATHAALAIGHRRQVENLYKAMDSRATIGQAVGVTMHRYGVSSDTAFQFLVRLSSTTERKLRDVAAEIIADAAPPE